MHIHIGTCKRTDSIFATPITCEFTCLPIPNSMKLEVGIMKNDPYANPELANAMSIAQFRFGLIAPVLQGTFPDKSAKAYYKRVAENPLTFPDKTVRMVAWKTLEKWVSNYKRFGFDSLVPMERSDKGTTRVLSGTAIEKIYSMKVELPRINGVQIHQKLMKEGFISDGTSVSTIQRFIRHNNLKGARNPNMKDRKAFEKEAFGQLWQADTKYMPYITEDGVSRRVFNISIIDDHSRMIVGGELFYEDNAANFQKVLKNAIAAYGIPQVLYVDNGAPYNNEQLSLICGELGIVLIHTKPRDGASKAKIERYWLSLDHRLNNVTDASTIKSLEDYNRIYRNYVRDYNTSTHTGIDGIPYERYENTKNIAVRAVSSSEWLDECFLNRIIRKVKLDSTISIDKTLYDVPQQFIRQKVEIRFIPNDMSSAFILYDDKKYPIRKTNKNENARTKRNNGVLDYSAIQR